MMLDDRMVLVGQENTNENRSDTMYVTPNYRTKTQLKEAVRDGVQVQVFSPGPFPATANGEESVEGPHYPAPHSWYARVQVRDGVVVKVVQ
jgi:hypothetical protein